jgi:hypothetical protein
VDSLLLLLLLHGGEFAFTLALGKEIPAGICSSKDPPSVITPTIVQREWEKTDNQWKKYKPRV